GAVTKNFGPLGIGVVSYAMIQTTGDSGSGARFGSFESRVYGVGPIVSFTTSADPSKALTVLAKWYSEFDAEHTFEGNTVDVAVSFKF
ncbi:MAG: transporter, partial [Actinomycetota bacterium]